MTLPSVMNSAEPPRDLEGPAPQMITAAGSSSLFNLPRINSKGSEMRPRRRGARHMPLLVQDCQITNNDELPELIPTQKRTFNC